jgi:addiction module HigA family antidote
MSFKSAGSEPIKNSEVERARAALEWFCEGMANRTTTFSYIQLAIALEALLCQHDEHADIVKRLCDRCAYLKELLDELNLSQYRLARELGVPAMRINYVVKGRRPVTTELTLRLGRYFGQSPRYWINLQSRHDMDVAEDLLSEQVAREVRPLKAAV